MAMSRMTQQQKENAIGFLTRKYGWSRAFCVEYIMERLYHGPFGMTHEQAVEEVNEKFRLAQQRAFANADKGEHL
jgi:hypothetical protein